MKPQIDKSMIQKNLKLTADERVKNHQGALNLVNNLRTAGRKLNDQSQRTTKNTTQK